MTAKLLSTAKLVKDMQIIVNDGRCHSVCLDLPSDLGTDMGPSALELCVMSYAGCFATIFVLTTKKMRITLKDLELKVEAIKSEKEGTITEASVDVKIKSDASEDRIQQIFNLTLKNCPVGKIFEKAGIKLHYKIENTADGNSLKG